MKLPADPTPAQPSPKPGDACVQMGRVLLAGLPPDAARARLPALRGAAQQISHGLQMKA